MTTTEEKLVSINAALAERAERLRAVEEQMVKPRWRVAHAIACAALKAQIRDLETEKHAILQELPL